MSEEKIKVTDVQFDIETLGRKPGCVVLSVSVLRFDRFANQSIDELMAQANDPHFGLTFSLSLTHQLSLGLEAEVDTLKWYYEKEGLMEELVKSGSCIDKLGDSIERLNQFFIDSKKLGLGNCTGIWTNSPIFDIAIIQPLYSAVGIEFPFPFYKWYDVRTIRDSFNRTWPNDIPKVDKTMKHNPTYDCAYQTQVVQAYNAKLSASAATSLNIIGAADETNTAAETPQCNTLPVSGAR